MRHGAGGPRLAHEALAHGWVGRELREERLDRDQPVQPTVASQVDDPHPTPTDHLLHGVLRGDRLREWTGRIVQGAWIGG